MIGKIKYQLRKRFIKRNGYIGLVGIVSLFLIVGGFSYAMFAVKSENRGTFNIVTGDLVMGIKSEQLDGKNAITVGARESKEITVTLKNENGRDVKFNFWYKGVNEVEVTYDGEGDIPPTEEGEIIKRNEQRTYKLIITNNSSGNQIVTFGSNGGFYDKDLVFPEGKRIINEEVESITVVKDNNMIAVVYNETTQTWEKAGNDNWYDYDAGKWANAVTVTSASRSKYQSAASRTAIAMSDIETMWVYIPRYSYTIGSEDGENYYGKQGQYLSSKPTLSLPGEIDVKFVSKSVKDTGSAQYKVAEGVKNWRTPDAFTFGNEELSGIWVGKFETSSSNPTAQYGGGNVTNLDAMIKPNVTSWRSIQTSNIAEVGRNITTSGNRYGFSANKLNSHAMKNSEWALVAYLSQSKYGKLGNRNYSGTNKEIYQNKSDGFITGCSYGSPSNENTDYGCQYTYEKSLKGTGASATGTIYGVYDMSGGGLEYMMGDYAAGGEKYSGTYTIAHSGYTGILQDGTKITGKSWLEDKYYDFYTSSDLLTACKGKACIGQALNETAGWYNDCESMVTAQLPWPVHGGHYTHNSIAGVFYFDCTSGVANGNMSFRLVLSAI